MLPKNILLQRVEDCGMQCTSSQNERDICIQFLIQKYNNKMFHIVYQFLGQDFCGYSPI